MSPTGKAQLVTRAASSLAQKEGRGWAGETRIIFGYSAATKLGPGAGKGPLMSKSPQRGLSSAWRSHPEKPRAGLEEMPPGLELRDKQARFGERSTQGGASAKPREEHSMSGKPQALPRCRAAKLPGRGVAGASQTPRDPLSLLRALSFSSPGPSAKQRDGGGGGGIKRFRQGARQSQTVRRAGTPRLLSRVGVPVPPSLLLTDSEAPEGGCTRKFSASRRADAAHLTGRAGLVSAPGSWRRGP